MSRREDDDVGMHHRHHRWHYQDQNRTDRARRDQDDKGWRRHRDRMTGRRDYDDDADHARRGRFNGYQHRWSHDDDRPRTRRFGPDRYHMTIIRIEVIAAAAGGIDDKEPGPRNVVAGLSLAGDINLAGDVNKATRSRQ